MNLQNVVDALGSTVPLVAVLERAGGLGFLYPFNPWHERVAVVFCSENAAHYNPAALPPTAVWVRRDEAGDRYATRRAVNELAVADVETDVGDAQASLDGKTKDVSRS